MKHRLLALVAACAFAPAFAQTPPPPAAPLAAPAKPSPTLPPPNPTPIPPARPAPLPPTPPTPIPAPTPAPTPPTPAAVAPHTANPQDPNAPVAPMGREKLQSLNDGRSNFSAADTNHDGVLSNEEIKAASAGSGKPVDVQTLDRNGDGRISADEWAQRDTGQSPPDHH